MTTTAATADPEGLLVAICGIDGAGKTTLAQHVVQSLNVDTTNGQCAAYHKLITPDSGMMKFYRYLQDVDDHFDGSRQNYAFTFERVRAALDNFPTLRRAHPVVIVDRYLHCDLAFSTARRRDNRVIRHALAIAPSPDIGIVIDVPVDVAMERIKARGSVSHDQENRALLRRARRAYLVIAEEFGFRVLDGHSSVECLGKELIRYIHAHRTSACAVR